MHSCLLFFCHAHLWCAWKRGKGQGGPTCAPVSHSVSAAQPGGMEGGREGCSLRSSSSCHPEHQRTLFPPCLTPRWPLRALEQLLPCASFQEISPIPPALHTQVVPPLELTVEQLRAYDGSDSSKPILLSLRGTIYDVTPGKQGLGGGWGWVGCGGGRSKSRRQHMPLPPCTRMAAYTPAPAGQPS